MSSAEFSVWLEMYKTQPWDDSRQDVGFAVIAATVANYAGKMRRDGANDAKLSDFMPFMPRDEVVYEPDPTEFFGKFL